MTATSATARRRNRLGAAAGAAIVVLTMVTGCAAAGPTADSVEPAAALPFPSSVTTPTPQTLPLQQPVSDPDPSGSANAFGIERDGPEVQAVVEMEGVDPDEAFRQLLAQTEGGAWFAQYGDDLDYWQTERDPFRFVAGSQNPDVQLPSSIAGYPVVLERSVVNRRQLQGLLDLVTTALRDQPSASSMNVRTATVEVWISHDAAAAALASIADKVAAMAPAVLVVHYNIPPPREEPPPDAASIIRFPAVLGGAVPAALAVGQLMIDDDGCVRLRSSDGDAVSLAVADYVDLVVTPRQVLVDGVDLGPPGPGGPVLAMGGGFWTDDERVAEDNPGAERCIGPGDAFHAYSVDLYDSWMAAPR